ncbi:MAG: tRNA (N(6)-L-threonylcarbamoyladenosine(37)-C(2))-methylthiotransferase MtaB [Candidatus Hydrogenedentota bacterium]
MNSGDFTRNHAKRASVHTLGCRLNQSESAILEERLTQDGYELVPFGEPADLGIINTCTVTGEADAKSRQLLRSFIRKNPNAYTAVIGCYAQMGHKALAEIEGVDLIVGNQEKLNILDYVTAGKNTAPLVVRDRIDRDDFAIEVSGLGELTRRSNLKIQDGCDFMCSFCIIPFARGRARSRSLDNILEEARRLVERGARELIVTGVNVGTYEWNGYTLSDVVSRLNENEDLKRIRISSIEPTTVPEDLLEWMADPGHKLVPYLHLPLQSGSNSILSAMRRKYTREEYWSYIDHACACVPDLCVGSDILVGFPGEDDATFDETLNLLQNSPLAYAHVFKYSERAGTASVRMGAKVSPQVINRRSALIRRVSNEKKRSFFESFVGRTVEVLFECEENGFWTGYTGNYIRVAVRSTIRLTNLTKKVTLTGVQGDWAIGCLTMESGIDAGSVVYAD